MFNLPSQALSPDKMLDVIHVVATSHIAKMPRRQVIMMCRRAKKTGSVSCAQ